ncbi:MAG: hypothetical protein QGG36_15650 [Pirellulaceae bacterium]|jgi:hypothetical protein|nr:hypothetical protein [Pirellulaceae bacterium]MDP7017240.1 hypothetical protein [Pirellulaceae bacterium]
MDALRRCAAATAFVLSLSATLTHGQTLARGQQRRGHRTENFIIFARTAALGTQVGEMAEQYRRELALEWLGKELPPWRDVCPIYVNDGRRKPASGVTTFRFNSHREPHDWEMEVNGTPERILDSVLPHEITHTVFATHFGQPLPRWADEGACTVVEHESERQKQYKLLLRFLTHEKGIPFNRMFAMRSYPRDILPLYAQGHSLTQFLLAQGGKQKFIRYIGEGMKTHRWSEATESYYNYEDLSDLQLSWVQWLKDGSPAPLAQRVYPNRPAVAATDEEPAARTVARDDRVQPASASLAQQDRVSVVNAAINQKALSVFQRQAAAPLADRGGLENRGKDRVQELDTNSNRTPPQATTATTSSYYLRRAHLARRRRLDLQREHDRKPDEGGGEQSERSASLAATLPVEMERPKPIAQGREIILEWQTNRSAPPLLDDEK